MDNTKKNRLSNNNQNKCKEQNKKRIYKKKGGEDSPFPLPKLLNPNDMLLNLSKLKLENYAILDEEMLMSGGKKAPPKKKSPTKKSVKKAPPKKNPSTKKSVKK